MTGSAYLSVEGVTKRYGTAQVLHGIDLDVDAGSYVTILGPSGSGKTTLLSILGGFTEPTSGRLRLDGVDITDQRPALRETTTVFQDYALFPHMSVGANVSFGLRMRRLHRSETALRVAEALEMIGLGGMERRAISELSGGQRQRVALARALVVNPKVLLLDEPLGALDMHLRWRMQEELWQLQRDTGAVFIHVTHDQEEAMNIGDVLCVVNSGRIEDMGPPARVYLHPRTAFAATFMGESNMLAGTIIERREDLTIVRTALGDLDCAGPPPQTDYPKVMFRPEKVVIYAADAPAGAIPLVVIGRAFQGSTLKL